MKKGRRRFDIPTAFECNSFHGLISILFQAKPNNTRC